MKFEIDPFHLQNTTIIIKIKVGYWWEINTEGSGKALRGEMAFAIEKPGDNLYYTLGNKLGCESREICYFKYFFFPPELCLYQILRDTE